MAPGRLLSHINQEILYEYHSVFNPPAPELLDLCDEMGFLVIDEAFNEWKRTKVKKGYHLEWDEWHVKDLEDMIKIKVK